MFTDPDVHKINFHFTTGSKFCGTLTHSWRIEIWTTKFWYNHKL